MKTKHVNLTIDKDGEFIVVSGQDQTEYLPGARLGKAEVDALCRNGAWKVRLIGGGASHEPR